MATAIAEFFNPYNLQVVTAIAINALLALSVYLPMTAGQLSLGGAGFMSVGAYVAALVSQRAGVPLPVALAAGALAGMALAFLLGYPVLRLHGVYLAIATLGFGEMVRILALNLTITNGALGLAVSPQLGDGILYWLEDRFLPFGETWAGLDSMAWTDLIVIGIVFAIVAAAVWAIQRQARSRIGRALAAIELDELAAQAMGIDIARYKLLVFAQSGFLAGLAGALYAHLFFFISPGDFGFSRAIEMLLFVVLGGQETVLGPLLGAGIVTALPEILRASPSHRAVIFGLLLLLMIVFLPRGLVTRSGLQRVASAIKAARPAAKRREPHA